MKSDDIHSALESVGEVAVFVWSLLELLLTRIFPLLGFLTGHLLLQCFQFLISLLTPTSASTTRPLRRSYDIDHQRQRQRHGVLPRPRTAAAARYFEDITNDDNQVPWQPPLFGARAPLQAVANPAAGADLKPSDAQAADHMLSAPSVSKAEKDASPPAEVPAQVDVAHSRPSDGKAAAAPTEQVRPSDPERAEPGSLAVPIDVAHSPPPTTEQQPSDLEAAEPGSLAVPVDLAHSRPLDVKAVAVPTEQVRPSDLEGAEPGSLALPVDVAHSRPLDAKAAVIPTEVGRQPSDVQRAETGSLDSPTVDKVKQDDDGPKAGALLEGYVAKQPIKKQKARERARRRVAKAVGEGDVTKAPEEERHVAKARLESISEGEESEEMSNEKADDDEATNGDLRRRQMVPPSLSQVKRSLMQRSHRGAASSSSSSATPSPFSAFKQSSAPRSKQHSPRIRKLVTAMKSSASYDNFMGQFRKHFSLD